MSSDRLRIEPNRLAHSRSSLPRRAGRRTVSAAGSDPLLSLSEGRPERHDEAFLAHRDADRAPHPVVERVFHPAAAYQRPRQVRIHQRRRPRFFTRRPAPRAPRRQRTAGPARKLPVAESAFGTRRRSGTQRPARVATRRPQSGPERTRSVPRSSRSRATTRPPHGHQDPGHGGNDRDGPALQVRLELGDALPGVRTEFGDESLGVRTERLDALVHALDVRLGRQVRIEQVPPARSPELHAASR